MILWVFVNHRRTQTRPLAKEKNHEDKKTEEERKTEHTCRSSIADIFRTGAGVHAECLKRNAKCFWLVAKVSRALGIPEKSRSPRTGPDFQ